MQRDIQAFAVANLPLHQAVADRTDVELYFTLRQITQRELAVGISERLVGTSGDYNFDFGEWLASSRVHHAAHERSGIVSCRCQGSEEQSSKEHGLFYADRAPRFLINED